MGVLLAPKLSQVDMHTPSHCRACQDQQAKLAIHAFIRTKTTQLESQLMKEKLDLHIYNNVRVFLCGCFTTWVQLSRPQGGEYFCNTPIVCGGVAGGLILTCWTGRVFILVACDLHCAFYSTALLRGYASTPCWQMSVTRMIRIFIIVIISFGLLIKKKKKRQTTKQVLGYFRKQVLIVTLAF